MTFTEEAYHSLPKAEIEKRVNDVVTSPDHYTAGGIETIDYMKAKMTHEQFGGYLTGNILKYISRYPFKNGVEDLKKAKVYLDWLIENEEACDNAGE